MNPMTRNQTYHQSSIYIARWQDEIRLSGRAMYPYSMFNNSMSACKQPSYIRQHRSISGVCIPVRRLTSLSNDYPVLWERLNCWDSRQSSGACPKWVYCFEYPWRILDESHDAVLPTSGFYIMRGIISAISDLRLCSQRTCNVIFQLSYSALRCISTHPSVVDLDPLPLRRSLSSRTLAVNHQLIAQNSGVALLLRLIL